MTTSSLFALSVLGVTALAQDPPPCPLTSRLESDWEAYVEEAEELGWYEDGIVDVDAVRERAVSFV